MGALIADGRGLVPLVGSLRSLEVGVLGDKRVVNTGGVRSPIIGAWSWFSVSGKVVSLSSVVASSILSS